MSIFNVWNPERVCRTRMISPDFFECKVKKPSPRFCGHSLCLGDGFICNHRDRAGFSNQK
jgi:hypothetical protein